MFWFVVLLVFSEMCQCLTGAAEGSYSCNCANGFTGKHCELDTDECDPNPCQRKSTCADGFLSYTCDCTEGSSGTNCEEISKFQFCPGLSRSLILAEVTSPAGKRHVFAKWWPIQKQRKGQPLNYTQTNL